MLILGAFFADGLRKMMAARLDRGKRASALPDSNRLVTFKSVRIYKYSY
jgi:hypothetical protein